MEAVIFTGLQAAGKSTFYKERFVDTHVRINMDMLRTRAREQKLLRACLDMKQPLLVDNTNPTAKDRARYIEPALEARFTVVGYYFASTVQECLARNAGRAGGAKVPSVALYATAKRLEIPMLSEGFSKLYSVTIAPDGGFVVTEMAPEPEG